MTEEVDIWLTEQLLKAEKEKHAEIIRKAAEKEFWQKLGLEVIENE